MESVPKVGFCLWNYGREGEEYSIVNLPVIPVTCESFAIASPILLIRF